MEVLNKEQKDLLLALAYHEGVKAFLEGKTRHPGGEIFNQYCLKNCESGEGLPDHYLFYIKKFVDGWDDANLSL